MSPGRNRGRNWRRTHVKNVSLFTARHFVHNVTHPSLRNAPTIVRLSPQFIGRASTYAVPRWTHAWDRPIAMLAPASSMKTKRSGFTRPIHLRNASRLARTSGRSISAGRGRFF